MKRSKFNDTSWKDPINFVINILYKLFLFDSRQDKFRQVRMSAENSQGIYKIEQVTI